MPKDYIGYTYKENGIEIRNTTNCYSCLFYFAQLLWKNRLYIDEEVVKSQIEILKKNEENYKNVPDPIFSFDWSEGIVARKTITQYIKDCS